MNSPPKLMNSTTVPPGSTRATAPGLRIGNPGESTDIVPYPPICSGTAPRSLWSLRFVSVQTSTRFVQLPTWVRVTVSIAWRSSESRPSGSLTVTVKRPDASASNAARSRCMAKSESGMNEITPVDRGSKPNPSTVAVPPDSRHDGASTRYVP